MWLDIDECLDDVCDSAALCMDTDGGFECTCNPGYSGDGFNCSGKDSLLKKLPFSSCT